MNRSFFAIGAAILATASAANAELVTAEFPIPMVGIALNYGSFGYTPEGGDYTILTDAQIVSSRVTFKFTPDAGVDPSALIVAMAVPVIGAQSEYFAFEGSDLIQTSPGVYEYSLVTDVHNGTIRGGRFGIETYGLDPDGNPVGLPGVVSDDSGFYFTVQVPEPTTLTALAGASLLMTRRRR